MAPYKAPQLHTHNPITLAPPTTPPPRAVTRSPSASTASSYSTHQAPTEPFDTLSHHPSPYIPNASSALKRPHHPSPLQPTMAQQHPSPLPSTSPLNGRIESPLERSYREHMFQDVELRTPRSNHPAGPLTAATAATTLNPYMLGNHDGGGADGNRGRKFCCWRASRRAKLLYSALTIIVAFSVVWIALAATGALKGGKLEKGDDWAGDGGGS